MRHFCTFFFLLNIFVTSLFGAFLENVPYRLEHPNGEILELFITGDEFFRRVHDSEGYSIVPGDDGWYYYALYDAVTDDLIPSEFKVSETRTFKLPMEKGLGISFEKYMEIRRQWYEPTGRDASGEFLDPDEAQQSRINGNIVNIIICVGFSDTDQMTMSYSAVNSQFNGPTNSVKDYFLTMSYNQLTVDSHFHPTPEGNVLRFYKDSNPRSYYHGASSASKEHNLLRNAVNWVNDNDPVPTHLNLDINNDGRCDYITFVVFGPVQGWSDLLWPHKWSLTTYTVNINSKRVYDYNFLLDGTPSYFNVGVHCHEGFHVLGAPDLYHYSNPSLNSGVPNGQPVGVWDLMESTNNSRPQSMSAFMKLRYSAWVYGNSYSHTNFPTATINQTYEVFPFYFNNGTDPNKPIMHRIPMTGITNQYSLVEYRKKSDTYYDINLPNEGLLIYRINTSFSGNAEFNGGTGTTPVYDGVFLYRPGSEQEGGKYTNGNLSQAAFNLSNGRTAFNNTTDPKPCQSNGSAENTQNINNILYDSNSDSYTFFYGDPINRNFSINKTNLTLDKPLNSTGTVDVTSNVVWYVSIPQEAQSWLTVSKTKGLNSSQVVFNTLYDNTLGAYKNTVVTFTGNNQTFTVAITQDGNVPDFDCNDHLEIEFENGEETFDFQTNMDWWIEDVESWLDINPVSGNHFSTEVVVTAEDNTSFLNRMGSFKVVTSLFSQIVTVTQAPLPMEFDINPKTVELTDNEGATDDLTVSANMPWQLGTLPPWISVTSAGGEGNETFSIIATDNFASTPRTGTLTILNSQWEQSATTTITQQGKNIILDVSTDEITLGFFANSNEDFEITASHSWTIISNVGWLTITPNSGEGNETINVKATENSSLTPRNALLTITSGDVAVTIDIIQEGFVSIFSLELDEININKENNSTETVELSSNRMWTAQKVGTWFNFTPTMGMADAIITITTTSENNTFETRTGTITFTNNLLEAIVLTVNQSGITECEVSLSANPNEGGTVSGDGLHPYNSEVVVTATPSQHYNFVNWTENGAEVSTSQQYTFTLLDNIALVANFTLKSYEVSVSALPSEGGNVSGDGMYVYNTETTVTATPSQHYNFVNWTQNGTEVSTSQNYTFIIIDDIELVANFTPKSYEVTVSAMPSEGGNVSGDGMYVYNTETTVTATPNSCYNFINWTNENNPVSTNPNYTFFVTDDVELVANFALKTFTVTITANSDEGNVTGGGTFECGTIINLVATPNVGYCFVKWLINGEVVETGTSYSFEITEDMNISVEFELCSYIVTIEAGEGGIVQGGGTYNFGENAEVIATPDDDYIFVNWTNDDGDEVSDENPFIFPVISDITLTANFEPVPIVYYTVTILVNNDEWGTVAGEGEYEADTEAEVTATPEDNYKFVNWTNEDGDEVSDNNPFIFLVTADITLTANFEYDETVEKTEISGFTLYPNPARDILTVISSTKVKATIEIFNGIGSLLQKVEMNDIETKIDVSSLSSGVYILRLTNGTGSSVLKFVKE